MDIIKVVGVAILGCIVVQILKKEKNDIAIIAAVFASVLIMLYAFNNLANVIELIYGLINKTNIDKRYLEIVLKITAIAYIASFGADICNDADNKILASKVEFAGKVMIISLAMPILAALIETVTKLI